MTRPEDPAQQLEALRHLVRTATHDINNMLLVISGCSQLLLDALPPDSPNRLDAVEIFEAVKRAATITSQLRDFADD